MVALLQARPFRKFVISLENGDRVLIEHPENVAFDPRPNSKLHDFSVVSRNTRLFSTFDAVSGVVHSDRGGATSN
jgi:hypothetical protein